MAATIRIYQFDSTNPYRNLALENTIFRSMNKGDQVLLLWRNTPSIIMGRFQNPWTECNFEKIHQDKINLVRRQSGGGCVYHDLGNLNITFMQDKDLLDKTANLQFIIDSLRPLGICLEQNARHDLLFDRKKVSGSAFKQTKDFAFHHMTLLIDSDLEKLTTYLRPKNGVTSSKAIASVRSQVTNIGSTPSLVSKSLVEAFIEAYPNAILCDDSAYKNLDESLYSTDEWVFGETPKTYWEFELTKHALSCQLNANKGKFTDCLFTTGSNAEVFQELSELLWGVKLKKEDVSLVFKSMISKYRESTDQLNDLYDYILNKLSLSFIDR